MSGRRRRFLFWALVSAYVIGSIWWVLYVPHDPARLLKAIPGSATLVSMHDDLAGRWNDAVRHPVLGILSGALGYEEGELDELSADPGFRYMLDLLGRNEFVTAYVPFAGSGYQPAWVLASWIGGRSHRLRLTVPFMKIEELERRGEIGNWPVWTYRFEDEGQGGEMTLALVEGMILGCISADPFAIETVIDAYNGVYPSLGSRSDLEAWRARLLDAEADDRVGYLDGSVVGLPALATPAMLEFSLADTNAVTGRVTAPAPELEAKQDAPVQIGDVATLWKDHPLAVAILSSATLYQNDALTDIPYTESVMDAMRATDGAALALGVFADEYSGRFRGIKVPSIMGAVQVESTNSLREIVQGLADTWNARYQWGVVPVLYLAGTSVVYRLEGIENNFYASFDAGEQIAFARSGDWLIASSNLKALEKLLGQAAGDGEAAWAERAAGAFDESGQSFAAVDLERAYATLRLVISAYSLKLLFEDPSGSAAQRQQLNEAKVWLEAISRLGRLYIAGESDKQVSKLSFETVR